MMIYEYYYITNARQNLFKLIADINVGFNPMIIVNNKDKNCRKTLDLMSSNLFCYPSSYEKLTRELKDLIELFIKLLKKKTKCI